MDHGFIYESYGDLQRLFGTSYDSACWQLRNMNCEIINSPGDKSEILAGWNMTSPPQVLLEISLKNGFVQTIKYRENDRWSFTGDGKLRVFEQEHVRKSRWKR